MIGRIVRSLMGKDKGSFMVVVGEENGRFLVADGRRRPLERPKAKSQKHLKITNNSFSLEKFSSNRALRKALRLIATECETEE